MIKKKSQVRNRECPMNFPASGGGFMRPPACHKNLALSAAQFHRDASWFLTVPVISFAWVVLVPERWLGVPDCFWLVLGDDGPIKIFNDSGS